MSPRFILLAATLALVVLPATGDIVQRQNPTLELPRVSPEAAVGQRLGLTDIDVTYHRPAVNERTIWGELVPYGQVWRIGANENTLISFSSDVTVEGEPLAAGSYGLHAIPGEDEWTVIFSKDTDSWGSFSYDEDNDALRVTVEPGEVPFHQERMLMVFDEVDDDSTTLSLIWASLRVPVKIAVDVQAVTLASLREQLKGVSQFFWMGWNQAANYCLQQETNYEEALQWIDSSIQAEERFDNLSTKAQILEKTGETEQAQEIMAKAMPIGNAGQLHNYARGLIGRERQEEALEIFQRNVEQNSDAWFVELGLARGHSALAQFDPAVAAMKIALEKAPEAQKAYVQGLVERLEKKEDIN